MHILVGILLALAMLYFWLIGHWFARVVTFLLLAVGLGAFGALTEPADHNQNIIAALFGIALAWPVSSVPIYYWRSKIRKMENADRTEKERAAAEWRKRLEEASKLAADAESRAEEAVRIAADAEKRMAGETRRAERADAERRAIMDRALQPPLDVPKDS